MYKSLSIIVLIVMGLTSQPVIAKSVMQPGGWEMRTKIIAKDKKTGEAKTVNESVSKLCLSEAFLAKDPYLTPEIDKAKMEQKKAKCSISDERRTENSASWKMACKTVDGHLVDVAIHNRISERKLTSTIQQKVTRQSESVLVNLHIEGAMIGACTQDMMDI